MFDLIVILVLAALAFPVIAVVALVRVVGLRTHVLRLDSRVKALEAGLVPREAGSPQAPATFAAAPPSVTAPVEAPLPPPLPPLPLPPPPSVPQTPVLATPPLPSAIGFEERLGTRWVVWVGGIALALGGIFLVRYTIQQGLIGPGVRIALGALLALALVAAGEWARRNERLAGLPGLPTADIPSILTAAGTVVAYAVVYA